MQNPISALPDLAARVRAEHAAAREGAESFVRHAVKAGELLNEAKAKLPHGQWLPWLENCGIGERTAQNYMRLARHLPKLEAAKAQHVADLTINGALEAVGRELEVVRRVRFEVTEEKHVTWRPAHVVESERTVRFKPAHVVESETVVNFPKPAHSFPPQLPAPEPQAISTPPEPPQLDEPKPDVAAALLAVEDIFHKVALEASETDRAAFFTAVRELVEKYDGARPA